MVLHSLLSPSVTMRDAPDRTKRDESAFQYASVVDLTRPPVGGSLPKRQ